MFNPYENKGRDRRLKCFASSANPMFPDCTDDFQYTFRNLISRSGIVSKLKVLLSCKPDLHFIGVTSRDINVNFCSASNVHVPQWFGSL